MTLFSPSCASIVGSEHARVHRNNQDAAACHVSPDCIVMAVADGCSAGRGSEVGARMAVSWLVNWTPRLASEFGNGANLSRRAADGLQAFLLSAFHNLAAPGGLERVIADFGLFTFLTAVITDDVTQIFGIGDGSFCVNGHHTRLEPGTGNTPAYLGYRLVDQAVPLDTDVRVHHRSATTSIESLWIATDGIDDAHELDAISSDPRYVENPFSLQRQLNRWGVNDRRLRDDTTIALVRRCA